MDLYKSFTNEAEFRGGSFLVLYYPTIKHCEFTPEALPQDGWKFLGLLEWDLLYLRDRP